MEYDNYDESDQYDFVNEFSNQFPTKSYITKNKPTNSLDYMKFHSEEYLKYKLEQKVNDRIKGLNLGEKYTKEILEICYFNYKLLKNIIRISDIIGIVTYKLIKKYNLPISNSEINEKLELNKSKYLKFGNKISVDCGFDKIKVHDNIEKAYENNILTYLNFIINRLIEYFKLKPNAIKIKTDKMNLDNYIENFSENSQSYLDILKVLEDVKHEAKQIILAKYKEFNFYQHFYNKVLPESLTSGIVKYLMNIKGIKLNLQIFRENFKIPGSSISKAMKMVEEYIKLNEMYKLNN